MIKEIKFGGYTAKPSDYECPDGDLAITSNLVPDDGALRPIMPPKVIGDVQADERFVFIHENIGYKHYIIEGHEGTGEQGHIVLKWTDDDGLNETSAAPAPGSGATADTGRYGFHGQAQQGSDEAEPLNTSTIPISGIQDEEGNRYPIRIIDDNAYGVWDGSDSELADNVNDSQPFIGAGHWLVTEYGQYIELADEDLGTIVDQTRFIAPGNGDAFIMREGAYLSTSEEIDYTDVSNHMYVHLDNEWIDLGVIRESQEDEGEGEGDGESEAKPDVDDEEDTPASTEPTTIDIEFEVGEGLRDITAVGNILIVASSLRMYYVLWRQNMDDYEDGYYLLGNEVPKVELEFALEGYEGEMRKRLLLQTTQNIQATIKRKSDNVTKVYHFPGLGNENYTSIMGLINSFVAKYTNEGKFIHPFFVRYAVKLYDGSYSNISSPILMLPNWGYAPLITNTDSLWEDVCAFCNVCQLQFSKILSNTQGWEDLIVGVDIFVSQPIYPYKQGEEFNGDDPEQTKYISYFDNTEYEGTSRTVSFNPQDDGSRPFTFGFFKNSGSEYMGNVNTPTIQNNDYEKQIVDLIPSGSFGDGFAVQNAVYLSEHTQEEILDKLSSVSSYYRIHTITLKEIEGIDKGEFVTINIKRQILPNLVTRPALTDNMLANRNLAVGDLYAYNNRLHVFGSTWHMPDAETPSRLNQHIDFATTNVTAYVYCRTSQGTKIVKKEGGKGARVWYNPRSEQTYAVIQAISWFFYPDNSAYKAVIVVKESTRGQEHTHTAELELKQHDFITGAYWINDDIGGDIELTLNDTWEEPMETGRDLLMPTSIYVSEADNPFAFRSQSVVNVGAQRVIELAAAARPLSQGQFGQFPLYAFTDEGVWALETTQTGSYIARQPFARDVLLSREAVTSLDDTVAFLSKRGLMMLAGRDAVCVSDILDNDVAVTEFSGIGNAPGNIKPFKEYIIGARILYDYVNQRLIVYSPTKDYAYVYSLRSKQWGMRISGLLYHLNSYPDALAVEMIDNDNKLVNLSEVDEIVTEGVSGTIITRPLKLDYPDALKTIDTLIVRGMFKLSDAPVNTILYGSRNLYDWVPVWSSNNQYLRGFRGTPYKFFRLVITCDLKEGESVSGCTVSYNPRYTNRLR